MGSQRVGHDLATGHAHVYSVCVCVCIYIYIYIYIDAIFPINPTFFFPCCVYKSVLYLKTCLKARLGVGGGGS